MSTLDPVEGIRLIEARVAKARDLLATRPLTRDSHRAWESTTRSVLLEAFGPDSKNLAEVMNIGKGGAALFPTTEEYREEERARDLATQIQLLESCIEQLGIKRDRLDRATTERATQTDRKVDPATVFVVHGRNANARDALFGFLRTIHLKPLEWSEALKATGKPTPYVGEILDAAFSNAQAVVVLMTPDDEAQLREPFRQARDPTYETELTPQARANVLFEAGMAMGRHPNRTILVELGQLRPFSDIGGRHVVRLDNSTQRRQEFAQRLEAAGCPVNLTGTDWHTSGNFELDQS